MLKKKKSSKLILQYSKDWGACIYAGVGVGCSVPLLSPASMGGNSPFFFFFKKAKVAK